MAFPSFPHYATKLLSDFNLSTCGNLAKEAYRRKGVSASRRISAYISVSQRQSSLAKHGIMQLATPTPGIQMDQMDESLHLDTPRFQISDFLQVSQACHLYLTYVYHPPLVGRHPSSIIHRPLFISTYIRSHTPTYIHIRTLNVPKVMHRIPVGCVRSPVVERLRHRYFGHRTRRFWNYRNCRFNNNLL